MEDRANGEQFGVVSVGEEYDMPITGRGANLRSSATQPSALAGREGSFSAYA